MSDSTAPHLPSGVRAIAVLFALCGIYLGITGLLILLRPGVISMRRTSALRDWNFPAPRRDGTNPRNLSATRLTQC